jgi:hypothetical protein
VLVSDAGHVFDEPDAVEEVAALTVQWFASCLAPLPGEATSDAAIDDIC